LPEPAAAALEGTPLTIFTAGEGEDALLAEVRFFFRQKFALEDAIEFHFFAPLEALPCV
jgi:hypothetical protein